MKALDLLGLPLLVNSSTENKNHPRLRLAHLFAICIFLAAATAISSAQEREHQRSLNWPYYGNDPGNMRYQNVDQINPSNVAQLKPAWVFHSGVHDNDASMETTPIVVNGIMYLTSGDDDVFAVNAGSGAQIWAYHPKDMAPISKLSLCCAHNNRGVAQGAGRLYLARLDATLVALDQDTGHQLWKATVDDWHKGYSMTIPPQYVNGLVIVGVAGGEYFIRGHVDAYNAKPAAGSGASIPPIPTPSRAIPGSRAAVLSGRIHRSILDLGCCMCRPAIPARTSTECPVRGPTCTPPASWPSILSPALCAGTSRNPITTSGITTQLLPRCCSR